MVADLLLLDVRVVGGEGDVDYNRHLRVDAVRAHQRAAAVPGDFLLRRGAGDDARRTGILRIPAERLEHRERADPVVDRARDDPVIRKVYRLGIDHTGITDADAAFGFPAVRGADVDPQVRHLRGGFAIGRLHDMDRFFADDAEHVAAL